MLTAIRTLKDDRLAAGYRWIWASRDRQREPVEQTRLNHKHVYGLTSQNGLLLQRYNGKPPGRAHDG
jgi:hypothetical protein